MGPRTSVYWGVEPYPKNHEGFDNPYPQWSQAQARDLGPADYRVIFEAAREWLRSPVLSLGIEGIVPDTQFRAALDLAIRHCADGKYSVGLHPSVYNKLLARLGQVKDEGVLTIREARRSSTSIYTTREGRTSTFKPETTMPIKLAATQANHILERLDRVAGTIQAKYADWGMPFEEAKKIVNALDQTADEIEQESFGKQSFERRQAEVLQRDKDESYMDGFENPMEPIETEADEPFMNAFDDDQSSALRRGKSTTGRPLA